jgi:RHS repeat-associated protein
MQNQCTAGKEYRVSNQLGNAPSSMCLDGCTVNITKFTQKDGFWEGAVKEDGSTCEPENNESDNPPPPPPPIPPNSPPSGGPPTPPQTNTLPPVELGLCTQNPIEPANAAKTRAEIDWVDGGPEPLGFVRFYNSKASANSGMGPGWRHNWDAYMLLAPASSPFAANIVLPSGNSYRFSKVTINQAVSWKPTFGKDTLKQNPDSTWTLRLSNDDSLWNFDQQGHLINTANRSGRTTSFAYFANGRLKTVTNPFGRQMSFGYNSNNQLASIQTPDGRTFAYAYDAPGRLLSAAYPDGKLRQFLYENLSFPHALTGIIDENNKRWGTFAYDAIGRATSSELAGSVSRYEVSYPASNQAQIKDPLGTIRNYTYSSAGGSKQVTSSSTVAQLGTSLVANRSLDNRGLVARSTDYVGAETRTLWNSSRLLPTLVTDPMGRTTSYEWHDTYRLPVKIIQNGRTTSYTYDAQARVIESTISDTSVTPNVSIVFNWSYNSLGLVQTASTNGTAVSYTYDGLGNVLTSTDSIGHITIYSWDSANRLAKITLPNGRFITYTWDARDRLLTQSSNGLSVAMTYTGSGQIKNVTDASDYVTTYKYDDAQRVTGWSDNRGNAGSFVLDAAGNRVQESISDSASTQAFSLQRTINSINRVAAETMGANLAMTYQYNKNGDLIGGTNALNESFSYSYDGSRRLSSIGNPLGYASLAYNAFDAITEARDFKSIKTSYVRDIWGNAKQEASPDAGTSKAAYDAQGLLASVQDATGRTIGIERDALGRITKLGYNDGTASILRYDLTGTSYNTASAPNASIGHLSEVQDPGVTTQYQRDALGRVLRKTQILAGGETRSAAYTYVPAGQGGAGSVQSITYPSGKQLTYQYSSTGLITGMQWNGAALLSGLSWNPLGMPKGWSWPGIAAAPGSTAKLAEARSYSTAGQLTHTGIFDLTWDAAGRVSAAEQSHMVPGAASGQPPQMARIATAYTYDKGGRLTANAHSIKSTPAITWPADVSPSISQIDIFDYDSIGYAYDKNGNRLSAVSTKTPYTVWSKKTTTRTYNLKSGTNILESVTSITDGFADPATTYTYDAAGAVISAVGAGAHYLSYGPSGRVEKVTATSNSSDPKAVSYRYNSSSQRVLKTDARQSVARPLVEHSLYSDADSAQLLGVYSNQRSASSATPASEMDSTEVIYLPTAQGMLPVAAQINGRLYAIHSDHLNTPRRLTNQQGQVAWQWLLTGFGEVNPTTGAVGFVQAASAVAGNLPSYATEVVFNLRYPGQQWDDETGLAYNINRYYDKTSGRYIQADPIGLGGGWNRFAYVNGNPLSFTDPRGLLVELRCRPADIAAGLVNHCWIKTDTTEAGMNEQAICSRAGNDASGFPFVPVVISDHSCDKPTIVTPLPNVDEACVNNELLLGKPLGRFAPPFNSCQTFTQDVIQKCSPSNINQPYIGYPKAGRRQ